MSGFTQVQQEALDKVNELLREHFDMSIVAVETEAPENTDRTYTAYWHGGLSACIGLAERTKKRLLSKSETSDHEEE